MVEVERSFTKKVIDVQISLGGGEARSFKDFACEVTVDKVGPPDKNTATVRLYGLSLPVMEEFTTLSFNPLESERNRIYIRAGAEGGAMHDVFVGEISLAYADFSEQPNVIFTVEAESGFYPARISKPALSVNGDAPVAQLVAQQAAEAGYSFLNRGVTAQVKNAYYTGSPIQKIYDMCNEVGCDLIIDDGEVIISPGGKPRNDDLPFLGHDSGLLGYPTFSSEGISARCIFRPDLFFGGLVEIESIVPKASGIWKITRLSHHLAAQRPGGSWECEFDGEYQK